jgi:hypothetical protein
VVVRTHETAKTKADPEFWSEVDVLSSRTDYERYYLFNLSKIFFPLIPKDVLQVICELTPGGYDDFVGGWLDAKDAKDTYNRWTTAQIREVLPEYLVVHYAFFKDKWNERIPRDSGKLAPLGTMSLTKGSMDTSFYSTLANRLRLANNTQIPQLSAIPPVRRTEYETLKCTEPQIIFIESNFKMDHPFYKNLVVVWKVKGLEFTLQMVRNSVGACLVELEHIGKTTLTEDEKDAVFDSMITQMIHS